MSGKKIFIFNLCKSVHETSVLCGELRKLGYRVGDYAFLSLLNTVVKKNIYSKPESMGDHCEVG